MKRLIVALCLIATPAIAQTYYNNLLPMGVGGGGSPSCDMGMKWLREHNFGTCDKTTVTDERCTVPEKDGDEVKCTIIPRPL